MKLSNMKHVYIPNFAYPFKCISTHDKEKSTYDLMMENLLYVKKYKNEEQTKSYFTHGVTLKMFDIMCKEGTDKIGIFEDTVKFYDQRESNTLTQEEKETLNPLFNEILQKIKIDKDKSGKLEAGELAGLSLSQEKRKELSYIVAKHESEWEDPTRFEALATFLDEMKATEYAKMMRERTKKLSFFDDVMAMDFAPTYFHPVALVGAMSRDCQPKELPKLFDFEDAKAGLKKVYDNYGRDMAIRIEKIMRQETGHFASKQFILSGTAGMEAQRGKNPPYYGWTPSFYLNPPIGLIYLFEGKGSPNGNKQVTAYKKRFIRFDSYYDVLYLMVQYLKYWKDDTRWHNISDKAVKAVKADYRDKLNHTRYEIVQAIEEGTLDTLTNMPHIIVIYKEHYREIIEKIKNGTLSTSENPLENDECEEKIETIEDVSADWHDPVDNPMLCLYTKSGWKNPKGNTFGLVRTNKYGRKRRHQGVDLFAYPGTAVYACMDGTIVRREDTGEGYGNVLTIKVDNPKKMKMRKKDFPIIYADEMKKGPDFNDNGDFYIF